MNKSNQVAKSAIIIIVFTLISKLLGFLREVLIAFKFGSGMETDTFFVALTATSLITGFITKAVSTTLIPIISEVKSNEGIEGKIKHTSNIINIIFIISGILVILEWIAAPLVIRILARGFVGEQFELAVKLTRIGLPMVLFGGIIGVFTGYLQSEEKFTSTALVGIPLNLVYILFLLLFSDKFGVEGLMVAVVLGVISQFLILIPETITSGYKHSLKIDFKDKYIKKVVSLSLPVLIGVAINDLNSIVDRTLASGLVSGSISALNYANKLKEIVLGIFIAAIITVMFPLLSKESHDNNIEGMKRIMNRGINIIILITVPASVGLIVLSTPIVQIAFERGVFDSTATFMTSQALIFYSVGLVAMALKSFFSRVYYSLQDTKTPMINGAISVAINIVLNLTLVRFMAHSGLALATSISSIITTILLLYGLIKKIGPLGTKEYIKVFIKTMIASLIMGIVSYIVYYSFYRLIGDSKLYNLFNLLTLMFSVGIGALLYLLLCYMLNIDLVREFVDKIIKFIKTRKIRRSDK